MTEPEERAWIDRIAQAPDDLDLRLVYADWLLAQGNMRGEIIVAEIQERVTAMLELHRRYLGDWLGPHVMDAVWKLGFATTITYGGSSAGLADMFARPAARFVERMILRAANSAHILSLLDAVVKQKPATVEAITITGEIRDGRLRAQLREIYPAVELPPWLLG